MIKLRSKVHQPPRHRSGMKEDYMLKILLLLLLQHCSSYTVANFTPVSKLDSSFVPLLDFASALSNATNLLHTQLPLTCSALLSVHNVDDYLFGAPSPALQECAIDLFAELSPSINAYTQQIAKRFSFCIVNPIVDRNAAFDFSQNLTFLEACLLETKGDFLGRLCGAGEISAYLQSLFELANGHRSTILVTTINCNDSRWSTGCEDGWSGSLSSNQVTSSAILYRDSSFVPERISDPRPCCGGFFCPRGLTCMIPCPLGAFCTRATLQESTGVCEPYGYQVSPGRNLTCGGANAWADVGTTSGIFCPAGFYCPATTMHLSCSKGHFCREGSTSQSKCFRLNACDPNSMTQNIKAYGIVLIVMLAMLLLLIYNCSDQMMYIRESHKAKVREAAVRHVREHFNAVERWKMAVEAAKHFSRSFSLCSTDLEEMQVLAAPSLMRSSEMGSTEISVEHRVATMREGNPDWGSTEGAPSMTEMTVDPLSMDELLEEDLYTPIEVPPVADKGDKKQVTVNKQSVPHTRSQIFEYAYSEIEKEKAIQNNCMTWMQILAQVGRQGNRERYKLEIAFKDLSLMLKGSGRKILCHVTGSLSPGRITAVMGPSGAGKTTFLNAVAGKVYNSLTTGLVLINGKMESIQSYKTIIGFVPQDDIVHGNLTVEENLWFSAHYRLPANMIKAEKVLIVERIIDGLGLQNIRSYSVGTVEKRGISGGQRKRVNVGLEMVMEPSLLMLDEPTSGLDSTSSQLVLKALRREALVGVNVGVVLHQPSYGLFKMFDDVMLLAKGGWTVYMGPVAEVEGYFSSMGIVVPERINPPDHYMDVLEGVAGPEGTSDFDSKLLPIAWMQNKGYEVPEELQNTVVQIDAPTDKQKIKKLVYHASSSLIGKSFANGICQEYINSLELCWDNLKSPFGKVEDLSRRNTPGFFIQFKIIFERVAKQRFRESRVQSQDYLILLLAGACLGFLSDTNDSNLGSGRYPFTIIALSLLCMISGLRTFSIDKLQYWRESSSGINRVAYFLAKDTVDHFNTIVKPMVYLSMFYFFNTPRSTFVENYIVTIALVYCVVGISYIFAITLENGPAQLWSVLLPVVSTLLATRGSPTGIVKLLSYSTYARWAQEAYVIANAKRYSGVWLITRCAVLEEGHYRLDHWILCLLIIATYGVVARIVAVLCLIFCNKTRQR